MSDYDQRNTSYDYTTPDSAGSAFGTLLVVLGVIGLVLLATIFFDVEAGGEQPSDPAAVATEGDQQ
ncbi:MULTISPECIES: hypothetical protein [Paracoccaceae]|jgi:hypothetical protein|uniref:hypothetical protein n=1 Tax=Rhodobacterales TaxID=204455 RepID=UPI001B04F64C|nr:hypothetical protein [Boseongicola sp. H5]MBO6604900.1 hypothetical protein [Roseicyclus sp.]MBO6625720.1 hypothetical protein [Roseicyclus sp.]MBO6922446.1 hypothetical protein [Roseicyclus sp.]